MLLRLHQDTLYLLVFIHTYIYIYIYIYIRQTRESESDTRVVIQNKEENVYVV